MPPASRPPLRHSRWCARGHAALIASLCPRYERLVAERKRELIGALRGSVLEIGPGAGANLDYLAPEVRWNAVEPNPYLAARARARAASLGRAPAVEVGVAEALPFPDASMDAAVGTLVLCSVVDVAAALAEVRRVLLPGGCFVFLEHVAAPAGSRTRRWQRRVRPTWAWIGGGCRPDRETAGAIERAGFSRVEIEPFRLRLPIVGPHIAGRAIR